MSKPTTVPASVSRDGLALIDGIETPVNLDDMMAKLKVEWTVRLHFDDFKHAKHIIHSADGRFVHFNLGDTIHQVGKRYALVPIVRPGAGKNPPLVDYEKADVVICSRVLNEVRYSVFTPEDYALSLPCIQSKSELQVEMCRRYCSARNMTEAEVLRTPVTLTEFRQP